MRWLMLSLHLSLSAGVWLGGEALLLRPTLAFPYSTIKTPDFSVPNTGQGAPLAGAWQGNSKPPYRWGYRVDGGYRSGCADLRLSWTSWIQALPSGAQADNNQRLWFLFNIADASRRFLNPGLLRRRDQLLCQFADGEMGYSTFMLCPAILRLFAGVRYARIRHNTSVKAEGIDNANQAHRFNWLYRSDIQGTGLRVGARIRTPSWWGFHVTASASMGLLMGTAKGYYFEDQRFAVTTILTTEAVTPVNLLIGSVDGLLGISYCWKYLAAQVGYQVNYFSQGMTREIYYGDGDAQSLVRRAPFALDGWTLRLAGCF